MGLAFLLNPFFEIESKISTQCLVDKKDNKVDILLNFDLHDKVCLQMCIVLVSFVGRVFGKYGMICIYAKTHYLHMYYTYVNVKMYSCWAVIQILFYSISKSSRSIYIFHTNYFTRIKYSKETELIIVK